MKTKKKKTVSTGLAQAMPELAGTTDVEDEEIEEAAVPSNIDLFELEDGDPVLSVVDIVEVKMMLKEASA